MKVLIAVDEDPVSHDALRFAANLLTGDTEVLVLNVAHGTVVPTGTIGTLGGTNSAYPILSAGADLHARREADDHSRRVVTRAESALRAEESALAVETRVEHGETADAVCRVAEEEGVDLVVLGTHDRSRWARLWFGSVSKHVVEHASCPVLVVR